MATHESACVVAEEPKGTVVSHVGLHQTEDTRAQTSPSCDFIGSFPSWRLQPWPFTTESPCPLSIQQPDQTTHKENGGKACNGCDLTGRGLQQGRRSVPPLSREPQIRALSKQTCFADEFRIVQVLVLIARATPPPK